MLDKNDFRYVDFDPLIRKGPLAGQAGTITPQLESHADNCFSPSPQQNYTKIRT
jgi:hypothetical protein